MPMDRILYGLIEISFVGIIAMTYTVQRWDAINQAFYYRMLFRDPPRMTSVVDYHNMVTGFSVKTMMIMVPTILTIAILAIPMPMTWQVIIAMVSVWCQIVGLMGVRMEWRDVKTIREGIRSDYYYEEPLQRIKNRIATQMIKTPETNWTIFFGLIQTRFEDGPTLLFKAMSKECRDHAGAALLVLLSSAWLLLLLAIYLVCLLTYLFLRGGWADFIYYDTARRIVHEIDLELDARSASPQT